MAITKILYLNEAQSGNLAGHLKNALEYIQNPEKTEERVLVGSINCLPETAFEQIGNVKVTLWVFEDNHRARRFYEKHGFHWDGSLRVSEFDGAMEVCYVRNV